MEVGSWIRLVVAVLATWRVTHLLAHEDGPADLIFRFRKRIGQSLAGKLMDCFYCLSLWIAAPVALFVSRAPTEWLMSWLALSGATCLLERMRKQPVIMQSMSQAEGESDVLRSETFAASDQSTSDQDSAHSR